MTDTCDVVIVGGGIAGSALAGKLARSNLEVLVLERVERFRDRVRGEAMMPWGVVEARRLGVEQLLLDAGGAFVCQSVGYDETRAAEEAEANSVPLGMFAEGVPGFLAVGHPQASQALADDAVEAGATLVRGTGEVEVSAGNRPSVRYELDGAVHEVQPRMVVGADGRASTVRKQLDIDLHETTAQTMLSGLLVEHLHDWPADQTTLGTHGDVHYLVFPRPGGLARLYLGYAIADKDRFTGPDRARHFLDAFRVDSLPLGDAIAAATPAGPCAGHPGTDSWTDGPIADGVVLIGDAAGWSDPLIGQGLSVALRDARSVADALLGDDDWSAGAFAGYAEERAERMRRIRVAVEVMTKIRCDFTPTGRARRAAYFAGLLTDPTSVGVMMTMLSGPEVPSADVYERENVERLLALGS